MYDFEKINLRKLVSSMMGCWMPFASLPNLIHRSSLEVYAPA